MTEDGGGHGLVEEEFELELLGKGMKLDQIVTDPDGFEISCDEGAKGGGGGGGVCYVMNAEDKDLGDGGGCDLLGKRVTEKISGESFNWVVSRILSFVISLSVSFLSCQYTHKCFVLIILLP